MDRQWKQYLDRYANDPFYWYQPKGFTISERNLPNLKRKLALLEKFEGRRWSDVQKRYTKALRQAELFKPTRAKQSSRDFAAIARMNKEVFDSLGVAWITEESIVAITDAGREMLSTPAHQLSDFVLRQLRRYQYPNPCVGRADTDAGIFPLPVALAVLTSFPKGVPIECYELFIARIMADKEISWAVKHIQAYLALSKRKQLDILNRLERFPILKEGRIDTSSRASSLVNRIRLNRSYMLAFLRTSGLVSSEHGRLRVPEERFAEALTLVREHDRRDCFIHFATAEDWIAFYGQPKRQPTFAEAIEYYRRRGSVDRALNSFRDAQARGQLPDDLQDLDEGEFRRLQVLEKTLEDFLEFNLGLLEDGLVFVARQHPTATGPLDILARDGKDRWIVIELKKGRAADGVIGQLLRYMDFIATEKAQGERSQVRGFVVAPEPDRRLIAAARGAGETSLAVFEFTVKGCTRRLYPQAI